MKTSRKFRVPILMILILGLLSVPAYAAYGSVIAISDGSCTTEFINDEFYNHINYQGRSKEVYADSNKVKNIYAKVICSADGRIIGTKLPAKIDSEIKPVEEKDDKYRMMLDSLHQRELSVLVGSNEFKMLNLDEHSLEDGSIIFIDRLNLENHLNYRDKYIDYAIDYLNEGDYISSGVYVNRENNELYIVSISENRVYTYKLD